MPALQPGTLVQPFLETVRVEGDCRVFLLRGEILAHVVRMPKKGGFISNFAQGGTGILRPLEKREVGVLERLGEFLKATGIDLAGADLIDGKISEVNITSPTGLRAFQQLEGTDYSDAIVELAERKGNF